MCSICTAYVTVCVLWLSSPSHFIFFWQLSIFFAWLFTYHVDGCSMTIQLVITWMLTHQESQARPTLFNVSVLFFETFFPFSFLLFFVKFASWFQLASQFVLCPIPLFLSSFLSLSLLLLPWYSGIMGGLDHKSGSFFFSMSVYQVLTYITLILLERLTIICSVLVFVVFFKNFHLLTDRHWVSQ